MAVEHAENGGKPPDRTAFKPEDTVREIWTSLSLPEQALDSLVLQDSSDKYYESSFKISHMAQSTIGLSALAAALIKSIRNPFRIPKVTIPLRHACLEYQTERLFSIDGKPVASAFGPVGGLHATADGHVRIHDSFPNHRNGTLALLGLYENSSREDVGREVAKWKKLELEEAGFRNRLAIYALRSYVEWDALPQSHAVSNSPVLIRKIGEGAPKGLPPHMNQDAGRCLKGLRVIELSRVIAAPTSGKTLAAHGADVLWVTSPNLPDLPVLDRNLSRGKRTVQVDLNDDKDREVLRGLVENCDVFIQGYRPEALAKKGFGASELVKLNPGLVYANLSAFGPNGPWSDRRGFDSLVQTCSGMNVSEAKHVGEDAAARPMPVQALDHSAGYLLATGIAAAVYRRAMEGGSWEVSVSLAGVSKYMKSLGQWPGKEGFEHSDPAPRQEEVPDSYFETRDSGFGRMRGLKHAAIVEGAMPGFEHMPKPLGSDELRWL